jgi:hypothetical protein
MDTGDTVSQANNCAFVAGFGFEIEFLDPVFNQFTDL